MPQTFHEEIQNNAPSKDGTCVRRLETSIQESDVDESKELIARDPDGSLKLAFEAQRPDTTEWLLDKG